MLNLMGQVRNCGTSLERLLVTKHFGTVHTVEREANTFICQNFRKQVGTIVRDVLPFALLKNIIQSQRYLSPKNDRVLH